MPNLYLQQILTNLIFYLPMHTVRKKSSTTTKIRAVFDSSAKSASNVSLNDTLLVGPTVHSSLIDVLLRFRLHRIALTADVSKMYRAIELIDTDRDLHRFVWQNDQDQPLKDYIPHDPCDLWCVTLIFRCQHVGKTQCFGSRSRIPQGG